MVLVNASCEVRMIHVICWVAGRIRWGPPSWCLCCCTEDVVGQDGALCWVAGG
jgi:hypothetical protein